LKQVVAKVISSEQILRELERPDARNILGSWIIWLHCPEIAREAKPGQFVMVCCGEECILPRPFSVHQVNDEGDIALFFAVWEGGKGTGWLSQREVGDNIDLFGPLGNGFSIHPDSHNVLLVAGGTGIAPLCFLAQQALNQGCAVRLLLGASTATQLYPKHFLPAEAEVITITEDGTKGKKGVVIDYLENNIDWADQVFACGPTSMYHALLTHNPPLLKTKPVQISLEVKMGCGRGVCYGCTVKTKGGLKQVCTDGPVFDLDDVLWDEPDFLTGV